MSESPDTRQLLLAYLLGELPPAERSDIEERMLADQDFSDLLQEAEYDLTDDYRAARLSPDERARVEAALGAERLAQSARVSPHATPPVASPKRIPPQSSYLLRWSLAAAVLVAASGWFAFDHYMPAGNGLPHAAGVVAPGAASGQGEPQSGPAPGEDKNSSVVLLLASNVTRGSGALPLNLSPSTRTVIVQWVVPTHTSSRSFQLSVTRDGKVVETEQQQDLQTIDGQLVAEFRVNPALFATGSSGSSLLLLIRGGGPNTPVVAEFPVSVSLK